MRVLGVRRRPSLDASWRSLDLEQPESWSALFDEPLSSNTLLVGIMTPDQRTQEAYQKRYVDVAQQIAVLADAIGPQMPTLWVGSTAVFGEHQGRCVESTRPEPESWRGKLLWEAECAFAQRSRSHVLRFSGLYDQGSAGRLRNPAMRAQIGLETVSNRMHREDAVQWLIAFARALLAEHPMPREIHGVDQLSVTYHALFQWLDDPTQPLLAATQGRRIATEYAELMPVLQYPTLREGLR